MCKEVFIGKIDITVGKVDPFDTTKNWNAQAENAVNDSDIKNQLQQHTLRGKVWKMLDHLDSLSGVVGAIDQAAKVCVSGTPTNSILMRVATQLNSYLDSAWKIFSSLYKVRPYYTALYPCSVSHRRDRPLRNNVKKSKRFRTLLTKSMRSLTLHNTLKSSNLMTLI